MNKNAVLLILVAFASSSSSAMNKEIEVALQHLSLANPKPYKLHSHPNSKFQLRVSPIGNRSRMISIANQETQKIVANVVCPYSNLSFKYNPDGTIQLWAQENARRWWVMWREGSGFVGAEEYCLRSPDDTLKWYDDRGFFRYGRALFTLTR